MTLVRGKEHAASLDGPGGWIVFESYNDWLIDQRAARRKAGIWSDYPEPAPFPINQIYEEYFSGMRAMREWKEHFSVKRDYTARRSIL